MGRKEENREEGGRRIGRKEKNRKESEMNRKESEMKGER